jgi:hypothetical protein
MDAQSMDLAKRAAQSSVTYAAMAGAGMVVLELLSKIPVLGAVFLCLNIFLLLGAGFGLGYLTAPKMMLPVGQTKAMIALWIGIGVAIPLTIALAVANLIGSIVDIITGSHGLIGSVFAVLGAIFLSLVGGLLVGTALAWLGSFFALDRNPNLAAATQMTQPPAQPF